MKSCNYFLFSFFLLNFSLRAQSFHIRGMVKELPFTCGAAQEIPMSFFRVELLDPSDPTGERVLSFVNGIKGLFELPVDSEGPHDLRIIVPRGQPIFMNEVSPSEFVQISIEEENASGLFSIATNQEVDLQQFNRLYAEQPAKVEVKNYFDKFPEVPPCTKFGSGQTMCLYKVIYPDDSILYYDLKKIAVNAPLLKGKLTSVNPNRYAACRL